VDLVRCQERIEHFRNLGVCRVQQICSLYLDPGHDHRQGSVVWKSHSATSRQILLKGGFDHLAQINGGKRILGRPTRTVQLAAQTGNDLVSESGFAATVAHSRKRFALFRELLNRLLYLVEMRMRFNRHGGESVPNHRTLFKDFRCLPRNAWPEIPARNPRSGNLPGSTSIVNGGGRGKTGRHYLDRRSRAIQSP